MRERQAVIVVGDGGLRGLVSSLEGQGFEVTESSKVEDLVSLLEESPGAIVIVYEPGEGAAAGRVLKAAGELGRKVPVVVVARQGNFEDYYRLMCEGAFDYFDLRDGREPIERAVRCAGQAA